MTIFTLCYITSSYTYTHIHIHTHTQCSLIGVDVCKEHVSAAIKWARDAANASLLRLQKIEAANEFAEFIERLIAGDLHCKFVILKKLITSKIFATSKI